MNKYTDDPSQDDEFALNFLVKCVISLQARVADLDPGVMVGSGFGFSSGSDPDPGCLTGSKIPQKSLSIFRYP